MLVIILNEYSFRQANSCCAEPVVKLFINRNLALTCHRGSLINSFHEKAALRRAPENTCYFATVNYASPGSPTTSAVVSADGTLRCYQPYELTVEQHKHRLPIEAGSTLPSPVFDRLVWDSSYLAA